MAKKLTKKVAKSPTVAKKTRKASTKGAAESVPGLLNSYPANVRQAVEAVRHAMADLKNIQEGVKWNSVSFRTAGDSGEWFATVNARAKEGIVLVLHAGAKGKRDIKSHLSDVQGAEHLKWLGTERAVVSVESADAWKQKWKVLRRVVSYWAECVRP